MDSKYMGRVLLGKILLQSPGALSQSKQLFNLHKSKRLQRFEGFQTGAPVGAYSTSSYAQPQRQGMGTGAAVGLGVGALAAGGLAGYALAGGFSSDSPSDEVHGSSFDGGDFGGGDDWAE